MWSPPVVTLIILGFLASIISFLIGYSYRLDRYVRDMRSAERELAAVVDVRREIVIKLEESIDHHKMALRYLEAAQSLYDAVKNSK